MKKTELMTTMNRTVHKVGFKLKQRSPEILVAAGIVGVVTSAVLACRATTKAGKIVEETKKSLDQIHKAEETGVTPAGESYSKEDCKKIWSSPMSRPVKHLPNSTALPFSWAPCPLRASLQATIS